MKKRVSIKQPKLIKYAFKVLKINERFFAYLQGKGYGSTTIKQEVNLLAKLLTSKPILAIDIGGNIGDYTAELIKRFPLLEIHTFEPSKKNIQKLISRFKLNENVKVLPYATSNISGSATLFSNEPGSGLGSLTKRNLEHFNIVFDTIEKIDTIRFEDYWKNSLSSKTIDFVKIDIEGHELNALEGFGDAIKFIKVLQFEFGGCNIDTRTYFQDFWYFFKKNNFSIYRITPIGAEYIEKYRESDEVFLTTNYIAVNTNLVN